MACLASDAINQIIALACHLLHGDVCVLCAGANDLATGVQHRAVSAVVGTAGVHWFITGLSRMGWGVDKFGVY